MILEYIYGNFLPEISELTILAPSYWCTCGVQHPGDVTKMELRRIWCPVSDVGTSGGISRGSWHLCLV